MLLWELAVAEAVVAVIHIPGCKSEGADCSLDYTRCNFAARTEDMRSHTVAGDCNIDRIVVTAQDLHSAGIAVLAERTEHQVEKYWLVG